MPPDATEQIDVNGEWPLLAEDMTVTLPSRSLWRWKMLQDLKLYINIIKEYES